MSCPYAGWTVGEIRKRIGILAQGVAGQFEFLTYCVTNHGILLAKTARREKKLSSQRRLGERRSSN